MQFLVQIDVKLPPGTPRPERERLVAAELARGRELFKAGVISDIWGVAGGLRNVGVWEAADEAELDRVLASLPLSEWLTAEVTPLIPLDLA
jgi:muconolactone D-isomerase